MEKPRVAFLGLGIMGSGMARRLLGAGFPLAVFNRSREKALPLGAAGARVAETPREAALGAAVVFSMVADDEASRDVWRGEAGALSSLGPRAVAVESSTISRAWAVELQAEVVARGGDFLDAPVTGSRAQAESGELRFLVGGSAAVLESVRPVLAAMGTTVVHLGPAGSGALMKLVNNFLNGVQVAALAEALALLERSGLDPARALEVITTGAPGSPMIQTVAARMAARDYTPHFPLRLMAKDLGYAMREGDALVLGLRTAAAARELFARAVDAGRGELDLSAVVETTRS
jgi:3-hydroxyisobutyrate dehydrogenase